MKNIKEKKQELKEYTLSDVDCYYNIFVSLEAYYGMDGFITTLDDLNYNLDIAELCNTLTDYSPVNFEYYDDSFYYYFNDYREVYEITDEVVSDDLLGVFDFLDDLMDDDEIEDLYNDIIGDD